MSKPSAAAIAAATQSIQHDLAVATESVVQIWDLGMTERALQVAYAIDGVLAK